MNKIKLVLVAALVMLMYTACEDKYKGLNTDPEHLGQTDPRNVFTGATENWNNQTRDDLTSKFGGVMQSMQYLVNYTGAQESRYVNPNKETGRPAPAVPYYDRYYSKIGLKLRYLVGTTIPRSDTPEKYKDLAAIANILEAYQAWLVLDVYGAAPYTEAFKIRDEVNPIRTPKYDLYQKDINGEAMYKVLDSKIKANIEVLMSSDDTQYTIGSNDYFYKGDVEKWIRFANSARIKMAQRLEKADADFYNSVLTEALSHAGGIISSNDESCVYYHPSEHDDNTDDIQNLTKNFGVSRALVNYLAAYDDPRLPILVRRNGFGEGNNNKSNDENFRTFAKEFPSYATDYPQWTGRYVGMSANLDSANSAWTSDVYKAFVYGPSDNQKKIEIRHNSQIESRFYVKNGGNSGTNLAARDVEDTDYKMANAEISLFSAILTYPEVCFMMAEIAQKKSQVVGGKDALTWFRDGVKTSMELYQNWAVSMKVPSAMNANSDNYNPITADKIDAYLARPEFQTVSLEKIISQQWVNQFMNPEEAWATWKRTGLPAFKAQPTPENGVAYFEEIRNAGVEWFIPRRAKLGAPNDENRTNYEAALKELTTDPNYGGDVDNTLGRIWWDRP